MKISVISQLEARAICKRVEKPRDPTISKSFTVHQHCWLVMTPPWDAQKSYFWLHQPILFSKDTSPEANFVPCSIWLKVLNWQKYKGLYQYFFLFILQATEANYLSCSLTTNVRHLTIAMRVHHKLLERARNGKPTAFLPSPCLFWQEESSRIPTSHQAMILLLFLETTLAFFDLFLLLRPVRSPLLIQTFPRNEVKRIVPNFLDIKQRNANSLIQQVNP